jgi:indolepyruvate ferredoxin oxidoreductase, beta subunit
MRRKRYEADGQKGCGQLSSYNILLLGVGGQGIILASNILSNLAFKLGLDIKKSEIHGMAQRGGNVESHVRIGDEVFSPLIPKGEADFVISMEQVEPLRHICFPKKSAVILVSTQAVVPPSVTSGSEVYPSCEDTKAELNRHFNKVAMIDVPAIMKKTNNFKAANIIMLGALSTFMPYPSQIWEDVIGQTLPARILESNLVAFAKGRTVGKKAATSFSTILSL